MDSLDTPIETLSRPGKTDFCAESSIKSELLLNSIVLRNQYVLCTSNSRACYEPFELACASTLFLSLTVLSQPTNQTSSRPLRRLCRRSGETTHFAIVVVLALAFHPRLSAKIRSRQKTCQAPATGNNTQLSP